jgi:stalled ribosome rescue protein Dom34
VGLKEDHAALWEVFSHVVKLETTIQYCGSRTDPKDRYNFYEAIINALRPTLKEGVRSIVLAAPPRTDYSEEFLKHVRSHHTWLSQGENKASFAEITGTASTLHEVTLLTRAPAFRRVIGETTDEETENLLGILEKHINRLGFEPLVLYSLDEIEDRVLSPWLAGKPKPEYIIMTDTYFSGSRQKHRLQRLQQIAANKGVKARTVNSKSTAGKRVLQFGGLVCILKV